MTARTSRRSAVAAPIVSASRAQATKAPGSASVHTSVAGAGGSADSGGARAPKSAEARTARRYQPRGTYQSSACTSAPSLARRCPTGEDRSPGRWNSSAPAKRQLLASIRHINLGIRASMQPESGDRCRRQALRRGQICRGRQEVERWQIRRRAVLRKGPRARSPGRGRERMGCVNPATPGGRAIGG